MQNSEQRLFLIVTPIIDSTDAMATGLTRPANQKGPFRGPRYPYRVLQHQEQQSVLLPRGAGRGS